MKNKNADCLTSEESSKLQQLHPRSPLSAAIEVSNHRSKIGLSCVDDGEGSSKPMPSQSSASALTSDFRFAGLSPTARSLSSLSGDGPGGNVAAETLNASLKSALWVQLGSLAAELSSQELTAGPDPEILKSIHAIFPQLKTSEIGSISNSECPIDLSLAGDALHSQLSSLDFDGGEITVPTEDFVPRPATWPTVAALNGARDQSPSRMADHELLGSPSWAESRNVKKPWKRRSTPGLELSEVTPSLSAESPPPNADSGTVSRVVGHCDSGGDFSHGQMDVPADCRGRLGTSEVSASFADGEDERMNLQSKSFDGDDTRSAAYEFCTNLARELNSRCAKSINFNFSKSKSNIQDLAREKDRIKSILRNYDRLFEQNFHRLPTRQEKEPMRNLYMHYRRVKLAMEKVTRQRERSGGDGLGRGSAAEAPNSPTNQSPESHLHSDELRPQEDASRQWARKTKSFGGKNQHPMAGGPAGNRPEALVLSSKGDTKQAAVLLSVSLQHLSLEEAEKKLLKLTAQKNSLAKRLQAFQEVFEKKHGRRIRYHRDIVEIDDEYRNYKKLRAHIAQLTEIVKTRRVVLTARGDQSPIAESLNSAGVVGGR